MKAENVTGFELVNRLRGTSGYAAAYSRQTGLVSLWIDGYTFEMPWRSAAATLAAAEKAVESGRGLELVLVSRKILIHKPAEFAAALAKVMDGGKEIIGNG